MKKFNSESNPDSITTMIYGGDATVVFGSEKQNLTRTAWTWFSDERAVIDRDVGPAGPRILVGGVTAGPCNSDGSLVVHWYDCTAKARGTTVLRESFEQDDHNVPALFIRPDGHYLATYAKHSSDRVTRWRITTKPHDPTDWSPEQTITHESVTTYTNTYRLPEDRDGAGRTYCFARGENWDPVVLVSSDAGSSWTRGGRIVTFGDDSTWPYARYAADEERIHVFTTDCHPGQGNSSIYHGVLENGVLSDSSGSTIDTEVINPNANVVDVSELTIVFEADTVLEGEKLNHAWTVDVTVNSDGNPVGIFQTRVDGNCDDHRFIYAAYDGDCWQIEHLTPAGGPLYENETDYTGLASLDPTDPSRVVVSTTVDPNTGATLDTYQLFVGITTDPSTDWQKISSNTGEDHIRPLVPGRVNGRLMIVWMCGSYHDYMDWESRAVGQLGF
jgi:hypothetical protein